MDWRVALYYPIGVLPSLFFTLRFVIQWIQSERRKESYVTPLFWKLSITGNILLLLHYIIQIQFPFALIQAGNGVISWRNLNLMGSVEKRSTVRFVFLLLSVVILSVTGIFLYQGEMIRIPTKLWQESPELQHDMVWHMLGVVGGILFASRFWIQWWQSETQQKSHLGRTFWSLSIVGSILMLFYFIRIQDHISIMNYSFGLIPYVRNLFLLRRKTVANS